MRLVGHIARVGDMSDCVHVLNGKCERQNRFEDLDVDVRVLECISRKSNMRVGLDMLLRIGTSGWRLGIRQ